MRAAVYARYSTEKQCDASVEDQFRECERVAKAAGLEVVARFDDKGISGGTATRPGYQALLAAARRREFEIIVAEDISRLWRNRAEFGPRSAELEDIGVHCLTCVGDDTRRDGWGLVIQIKQAIAEHARREASYRTRRGVEGKALAGESTGGKAYGYIAASDSESGKVEIDEAQSGIVRRVFQLYADGASPRSIASRLNVEGVPSPGASWKRTKRCSDGKWLASAIHGDAKRGTGILNNRRYTGMVIWGRSKWTRGAADSAKRTQQQLNKGVIERLDERLRIVSDELWQRVKTRQAQRSAGAGAKVKAALRRRVAGGGLPPKYLFSGLLRCAACEASFTLSNGTRYQCSSHHEGGDAACGVSLSLIRTDAERLLLDFVEETLFDPKRLAAIEERYVSSRPATVDLRPRLAELERQIQQFVKAIGAGEYSLAISAALKAAEGELEQLRTVNQVCHPRPVRRASTDPVAQRVRRLRHRLAQGGDVARGVLQEVFPDSIWLDVAPSGKHFYAIFEDGVRAALGFDDRSDLSAFPIEESDGGLRKVGNNGSGGRI